MLTEIETDLRLQSLTDPEARAVLQDLLEEQGQILYFVTDVESLDRFGYGFGSGYGDGDGYGFGFGSGEGNRYGGGYGFGYGYGEGYGFGNGEGMSYVDRD